MLDLGHALTIIHGKGMRHCDIKLDNIMIRPRPSVAGHPVSLEPVITDFGESVFPVKGTPAYNYIVNQDEAGFDIIWCVFAFFTSVSIDEIHSRRVLSDFKLPLTGQTIVQWLQHLPSLEAEQGAYDRHVQLHKRNG